MASKTPKSKSRISKREALYNSFNEELLNLEKIIQDQEKFQKEIKKTILELEIKNAYLDKIKQEHTST